ncbi:MAG TPA: serine hydrolase domain-containing protein [Blastocatellia bacterium]|nr:serine hydrolase domain-containing protein [Blastocatellia bacterium]
MHARILSVAFFFLAMATINAQTPKDFGPLYQGFKTYYVQKLKQHGIVGSSFYLLHDNQVLAQEFYGLAHQEQNRAVDENTIYHWASITKTFTGIAIMQLRDHGLLKLDDPIIKYVPELKDVHNPFGKMEDITLRHLMSHSAGFRDATWPWGGSKEWHPHEPRAWSQLVAMMPYTEIEFQPGSKMSYSNPGIIFLGRVIETLTKDDYEVYIDKNIFKPLEMYRSYFDATPYHLLKHRAASYWLENGKLRPARFDVDTGITVSNGGLNAPLPDMVKYLNFLMGSRDKQQQAMYDAVLKRSSLEEMWQPQLKIEPAAKDGENRKDAMGLTYFIEDNFGQHFIGHSGGQNGFISHFYLRPDTRTAYIVAFNTHALGKDSEPDTGQNTRTLDREIKDYLFKKVFPHLAK